MGNFNECCPHCAEPIEVQSYFESNDYSDEFTFDCPYCNRAIEVDVHAVPEFELSKPRCKMCGKTTKGKAPYCPPCKAQLQALSDRNESPSK